MALSCNDLFPLSLSVSNILYITITEHTNNNKRTTGDYVHSNPSAKRQTGACTVQALYSTGTGLHKMINLLVKLLYINSLIK